MDKKAMEMGFAWIFAILVGMAILFLAIFGATKYVGVSETEVNTKTSKALLNVLDELQTTVQESSSDVVPLSVDTKIFTSCNTNGDFGNTVIEISERGLGNKFSTKGGDVSSENAYLFAEDVVEGKDMYFLTFQFNLPYKIGDITTLHASPYCFVNTPSKIENEIRNLAGSNPNLVISKDVSSCVSGSTKVCFNSFANNCDVEVQCEGDNCESGIVKKEGRNLFFTKKLLYGSIFASKENYECNVERLVKRTKSISDIYAKKALFVSTRGCDTGLRDELMSLINTTGNYGRVENLALLEDIANDIEEKNKDLGCQLY